MKIPIKSPRSLLGSILLFALPAQSEESKPEVLPELQALKDSLGVWKAKISVWPQGLDNPPFTFEGLETNRAFGSHWLSSDFEFYPQGQTMRIHSIVGYDLEKEQLVGTVIDHGPYAASLSGKWDEKSSTVSWTVHGKNPDGSPIVQHTTITHKSPTERVLVLRVPKKNGEGTMKSMEIVFTKQPAEKKAGDI
ncbi:MAG: DUF1579 family protein [Verrucomicrobiota bacterium]